MNRLMFFVTLFLSLSWNFAAQAAAFNFSFSGNNLSIYTLTPNIYYPTAGLRINTAGYQINAISTACSEILNGYCLFGVSNTQPAVISISGPVGDISITLCLNAKGPVSCETHTVSFQGGALFQVSISGNDLNIRSTVPNYYYSSAGIKVTTPGYQIQGIGSSCTLFENGYCLFGVSNTQSATIPVIGPGGNFSVSLCLDGKNPAYCDTHSFTLQGQNRLYVTEPTLSAITLCTPHLDGTLSNCIDATGAGNFFSFPANLTLNAAGTVAYILDNALAQISVCPIQADGILAPCIQTIETGGSGNIGMALNPFGDAFYFTLFNENIVKVCAVNPNNGSLGECTTAYTDTTDASLSGIAFNLTSPYVYLSVYDEDRIDSCVVNPDKTFSSCSNGSFSGEFDHPFLMDLNSRYLYSTNLINKSVSVCILGANGVPSDCRDTGFPANSAKPYSIALNSAGTLAYITNFDGRPTDTKIYACSINAVTGLFDQCINTQAAVNAPRGIALVQ